MTRITAIVDSNHYDKVTKSGLVVVKCGATWCGPCNKIAPEYEALSVTYNNISFYALDIDTVGKFADSAAVTKLPTFLILKDGAPIKLIQGLSITEVEKTIRCAVLAHNS